jgi:hypothetical protein
MTYIHIVLFIHPEFPNSPREYRKIKNSKTIYYGNQNEDRDWGVKRGSSNT